MNSSKTGPLWPAGVVLAVLLSLALSGCTNGLTPVEIKRAIVYANSNTVVLDIDSCRSTEVYEVTVQELIDEVRVTVEEPPHPRDDLVTQCRVAYEIELLKPLGERSVVDESIGEPVPVDLR